MAVKKSKPGDDLKGSLEIRGADGRRVQSSTNTVKKATAERSRTVKELTESQRLEVIKHALNAGFVDALKLTDADLLALINIGSAVAGIHETKLTICALDFAEIVRRVAPWAGGLPQALEWYRNVALPGYGKTAAELTREGRARSVRMYLDEIAAGGYA